MDLLTVLTSECFHIINGANPWKGLSLEFGNDWLLLSVREQQEVSNSQSPWAGSGCAGQTSRAVGCTGKARASGGERCGALGQKPSPGTAPGRSPLGCGGWGGVRASLGHSRLVFPPGLPVAAMYRTETLSPLFVLAPFSPAAPPRAPPGPSGAPLFHSSGTTPI